MSNEIRFKFSADRDIHVPMVERILKEGLEGWEVFYRNEKPRGSHGSLVDVSIGFKAIPSFYREDLGVSMTDKEYKAEMNRQMNEQRAFIEHIEELTEESYEHY